MQKKYKIYAILAGVAILLAIGFFIGRGSVEVKEHVEYVQLPAVHDTIDVSEKDTVLVSVPSDPVLPMKPDTIFLPGGQTVVFQKVDTAKIIAEFVKEKSYYKRLFDDEKRGTLDVGATVQYNRLTGLTYDFIPVEKVVTEVKKVYLEPYVMAGYSTTGEARLGGGVYWHNLGIGVSYVKNPVTGLKGYGVDVGVKF